MTLIYGPPNYFEIFFMEACITVNSWNTDVNVMFSIFKLHNLAYEYSRLQNHPKELRSERSFPNYSFVRRLSMS